MRRRLSVWPALALCVLASACGNDIVVSSDGRKAEDLQASLRVVEQDGVAVASASFRVGPDSTPIVQLQNDDTVWAHQLAGADVQLEESWTDADWPEYVGDFDVGSAAESFSFVLFLGDEMSSESRVHLPPAFTVTSPLPGADIAADEGMNIAWVADQVEGDDWWVKFEGDCIQDTSYIITPNPLVTGPLERDGGDACDVTVLVRRSLDGEVDPVFLPESRARGSREVVTTVRVQF